MNEVIKFLNENPIQYFATIGLDNKPKIRPFQFMLEDNNKLYFCTSNQKEIYKELQKNPYIEICISDKNFAWLRLNGKVVFSKDENIKKKIIENNPLVKSIYKEFSNPIFEIFYLEDAKGSISTLSTSAPKIYSL
jgi:uncharacterized pyridoxamine 5'-phosphate oxidase family protein